MIDNQRANGHRHQLHGGQDNRNVTGLQTDLHFGEDRLRVRQYCLAAAQHLNAAQCQDDIQRPSVASCMPQIRKLAGNSARSLDCREHGLQFRFDGSVIRAIRAA